MFLIVNCGAFPTHPLIHPDELVFILFGSVFLLIVLTWLSTLLFSRKAIQTIEGEETHETPLYHTSDILMQINPHLMIDNPNSSLLPMNLSARQSTFTKITAWIIIICIIVYPFLQTYSNNWIF